MPPKGQKSTSAGPSKRQRGDTSNPYRLTFVSDEAEERFNLSIVGRKCIQERGFHNPPIAVQTIIEERQWGKFAKQPGAALVPVVREFYANAKEHQHFKALVRGKRVPFDSKTINQIYQLPDLPEDDYSRIREEGPDYEEIINFLAKPGTK